MSAASTESAAARSCGLTLMQCVRGVQVGDPTILGKRADMRTRRVIQKSNKSHRSTKDAVRLTSTRELSLLTRRPFRKRTNYCDVEGIGVGCPELPLFCCPKLLFC